LDCLSIARADKLMTLETDRKHMLSSNKEDEQRPFDVSEKTLSLILKKKVYIQWINKIYSLNLIDEIDYNLLLF
jgi:hypothetical protein